MSAVVVSAALLSAAACSDATKIEGPSSNADLTPSYVQNDETGYLNAHIHIMPVKSQAQEAHSNAKPSTGSGMVYHGGPVLRAQTNVVAVYWASSAIFNGGPAAGTTGTGSQDGSLVGHFLRNIGGSPYYAINSTYTDGAGVAIANVVNYTGFWANNTNAPSGSASVSDAQMVAMLQSGLNSGAITYDANALYAIFTAGQVNLGGGFGTQYCAYHTHGTVTVGGVAKTILYAAMPYNNAYPGACTNGTPAPNGDAGADAEVITLVHEIEETTTDMMGNAWFDRRGYENADKCAWTWGTTSTASNGGVYNVTLGGKNFLIQQNWKNSGSGGCAMHL
jgi:hypothetical protein